MTGDTAIQLHVQQWGQRPSSSIPLVMLHGHPGNAACFEPLALGLQQNFWILAPDLRGYGRSQVRQSFEMATHLLDLERLLDEHEIGQCLIVGWSLGGIVALELAIKDPSRIQGLVLMASAARPVGSHPPVTLWDDINTGIASVLNLLWPGSWWVINQFGKRSLYRYLIHQHTPETYRLLARYAVGAYLQTSTSAKQALRQALRQRYNRLEAIANLRIPTLVLTGLHDRHITCAASLETAQTLPLARWITYPHVAHLFPWEIPDQVEEDIRAWFQQMGFL